MTDEPKVGDWLIYREYRIEARQIDRITPQQYRFTGRWPRQLGKGDRRILGFVAEKDVAERLKQSIDGIDGEYSRREREAKDEYRRRESAARDSRDATIARLFQTEGAK